MIRFLIISLLLSSLVACSCPRVVEIDAIQKSDKSLTCRDIKLEINEAEYFRRISSKNQFDKVEYYVNPVCLPSGYINNAKSEQSANKRLDYLANLYNLLGCNQRNAKNRENSNNNVSQNVPSASNNIGQQANQQVFRQSAANNQFATNQAAGNQFNRQFYNQAGQNQRTGQVNPIAQPVNYSAPVYTDRARFSNNNQFNRNNFANNAVANSNANAQNNANTIFSPSNSAITGNGKSAKINNIMNERSANIAINQQPTQKLLNEIGAENSNNINKFVRINSNVTPKLKPITDFDRVNFQSVNSNHNNDYDVAEGVNSDYKKVAEVQSQTSASIDSINKEDLDLPFRVLSLDPKYNDNNIQYENCVAYQGCRGSNLQDN
ncbi:MAG: hypothetical protein AAF195_03585 [Pseudomonadota bacterium]